LPAGIAALMICLASCKGSVGKKASGGGADNGGTTGNGGSGGGTLPPPPYEAVSPLSAVRKVKNLLTGLAPTDDEVAAVKANGAAGLRGLITTWTTDPAFQPNFRDKMVFFFRNAFQQTAFTPTEDFKPQLLQNGGFDFGPLGTNAVGDDAFQRLVENVQDSFALTAWQLVADGRPFTDILTTQRFMMTTGLKSLYLQIEMPNDQPFAFAAGGKTCTADTDCGGAPMGCNRGANTGQMRASGTCQLAWKVDMSGNAIPLTDTLNPSSPNYMIFDDQVPLRAVATFTGGGMGFTNCHATTQVNQYYGYAQLFQRLMGMTQRWPFTGMNACIEHASKPYLTTQDLSDWQWVTTRALRSGEARLQPFDLPTLRGATELALQIPRVGFYTTPAYLALWNTNDSNQHRVTANQTLLVALGQGLTSSNTITPLSMAGLDASHAVNGTECYGCHKILDPLRQFWGTQIDFNDRNDFPTRVFNGGVANPRPTATGGLLAFGNVNAMGAAMTDLGPLLQQVIDGGASDQIQRFAVAFVQKLCFFANSSACVETDPEFRRIASGFQKSNYDLLALVKDLFSSPLVTGLADTATFDQLGMTISISRRDQLCASLSNRLQRPDICALTAPVPSTTQAATVKIATSVPADAFSRGTEFPVTASDPTLFYRAASEMLCENVATQVVDPTGGGGIYVSTSVATSIDDMVTRVMGYPPADTHHAQAVQILQKHYDAVIAQNRSNTPTVALRSTFALACESPTALSFGM
jgi:hypothetical protein